MSHHAKPFASITVIYDGDCPLCSRYAAYQELALTAETVQLLDARALPPDLWADLSAAGIDVNAGVVVRTVRSDGRTDVLSGRDAVSLLAALDEHPGALAWLHRRLRAAWLVRWVYPLLFAGRRVLLFVLRVPARIAPPR